MEKEKITATDNIEIERATVVTVWLWIGIISTIISCLQSFPNILDISNTTIKNVLMVEVIVVSIMGIIAYSLLFAWEKKGFYIFVIAKLIDSIVASIFFSTGISSIIVVWLISIFSIVFLRAILQIKKNGVSCWSQLD